MEQAEFQLALSFIADVHRSILSINGAYILTGELLYVMLHIFNVLHKCDIIYLQLHQTVIAKSK